MRGVRDEVGADLVGDVAEVRVVGVPRVGDGADDDGSGAVRAGEEAYLVVVDQSGLVADSVADEVEPAAGEVGRGAVGEVSPVREAHGQDRVAGAQQRGVRGEDGGGAGVRLDVGVLGAEEGPRTVDGEALGDVDQLAAAVVAGAG